MADIVMVEDDDDIRDITAQMLRRAGHSVVETADGAAGLQAIMARMPDLVVSDIDMPVMSGLELCQALRSAPQTADLPVMLISGSLLPGDPRPFGAQASAVLVKPFSRDELIGCVKRLLQAGDRAPGN
jgi:CheY-like chemotaxis protein